MPTSDGTIVIKKQSLIKDNEGSPIGTWKDMATQGQTIPMKPLEHKEWSSTTQEDIIKYYYRRQGDGTGEDFDAVCDKMAATINRLFNKNLDGEVVLNLLIQYVSVEFLNEMKGKTPSQKKKETSIVTINLNEKKYFYKKDLKSLNLEKAEICNVLKCKHLCFSGNFHLACQVSQELLKEVCPIEKPFKGKENIMYEMFKDQVGDLKAKKLVIMTRILNKN